MTAKTVVAEASLFGKIAGYIEILVKDPHSTVFVPLSEIYRKLGLLDEAVTVARKGTQMVPAYAPGFVALARGLAEQGDHHGSAEAFRAALSLEPDHLPALTGLARVYLLCGDRDAALACLQSAQAAAPGDEQVARLLASVQGGRVAATSPAPPAGVAKPPVAPPAVAAPEQEPPITTEEGAALHAAPPIATATIADIYIRQGFPEKALKVLADLLQAEPGNGEIRKRYESLKRQLAASEQASVDLASAGEKRAPEALEVATVSNKEGRDGRLLAACNRWLAAVERRRAHVR